MFNILSVAFIATWCVQFAIAEPGTLINTPESKGAEVVEQVVDLIGQTCLLDNELFLRRMAYVETDDGTSTQTYRAGYHGGIWDVDESMFNATKNQPKLIDSYQVVKQILHIDWSNVTWKDLRKPINSGLAVAMYLLSQNIRKLPETKELQATIWGTLKPGNNANTFFFKVQSLKTGCDKSKALDLVIVLDFLKLSPFDLVKVHTFLDSLLKSLPLALDGTRAAIVTKRMMPIAEWYLNSQRPGLTILNSLKALTYTPGPTTTKDQLKFARETMFTTAHGARPGSAKVILLLTDGITQYSFTKDENHLLQNAGISLVIVEIDPAGNGTSRSNLDKLVSPPTCRHARIVNSFATLTSIVEELKQTFCKAPVVIDTGLYTIPCNKPFTAKLPDTSSAVSVKVSVTTGSVDIFAAKMYNNPDQSSNDVHMVASSTDTPVLFVRGTYPMYIQVKGQPTCTGTYTVHIQKNQVMGGNGKCVIAGVVRDCSNLDMVTALHDIVLIDSTKFPYLCDPRNHSVEYFPHPLDTHKFIMCDQHDQQYVGLCPVNQSDCKQLTAGCKYSNPCTRTANLVTNLHHNDPCGNSSLYITCSNFGIAEVSECTHMRVWNQDTGHCVFKYVHNPLKGTNDVAVPNPCIHAHEAHDYFPFPNDPKKYILCDVNGNAFENVCRGGLWNQQTRTCANLSPAVG